MRNYLTLWLTDLTWTDPNTFVQTNELIWGRDEDEMAVAAGARTLSFGNQGISYVINFSGKAFPMMDKAQVFGLIQVCGSHGIAPSKYAQEDTPRDTWKPSRDDKNVNPGTGAAKKADHYVKARSEASGAVTTVSTLTFLELLLAQWELGETSQGRRLGGVLVPARWIDTLIATIAKLKAGKITGDEALAIVNALK